MIDLAPNGHFTTQEIDKEKIIIDQPRKKSISVVCNLKQARWEQVSYLSIINK